MCELEAGIPTDGERAFHQGTHLAPDFAVRPIADYYLRENG